MTISLAQQIEEIEREIELRAGVYARAVASGKMRQSIAEFHTARIAAACATLKWVQRNEVAIKAALERKTNEAA